jgi:uncharacterized protein YqeY
VSLQEQIKKDLQGAMKAKNEEKKSNLRVIMGEFGRAAQKELDDDTVIGILKKLLKAEREVLERQNLPTQSAFTQLLESYLPQMASEEEIRSWISANIDFEQFKNKMQAMKPIMQHFGSGADGNTVKKVLQSL